MRKLLTFILYFLFLLFTAWWIYLNFVHTHDDYQLLIFGSVYGFVALVGAICGFITSNIWGGFRSMLGRSLAMFSLGLFMQEFGQVVYSYYNLIKHIQTPYPSLGDLGFFGSIPFYIYGVILLANASGAKISLKSFRLQIQAVVIPLVVLVFSYLFFLRSYEFDWTKPLTIFLDFGYPMGEAVYISLALLTYLLSRNILGGIMKHKVLGILFALSIQYMADFTFLHQSSLGTWTVGGINDYMYLLAYFAMSLSLLQFNGIDSKPK